MQNRPLPEYGGNLPGKEKMRYQQFSCITPNTSTSRSNLIRRRFGRFVQVQSTCQLHKMEDKRELDIHETSSSSDAGELGEFPDANAKRSIDGIILIPQPSDDPDDPLVSFTRAGHGKKLIPISELASMEKASCSCCTVIWIMGLLCDRDSHCFWIA